MRMTLILLALIVTCSSTLAKADAVDTFVLSEMKARNIPGVAIAVIRDGVPIKTKAYGVASLEFGAKVTLNTRFGIASLTKTFTAAAIMHLVQTGRLKLDDRVTTLIPGLPASWEPVSVRHCLSHTSGLPDTLDRNERLRSADQRELMQILAGLPVKSPQTEASYIQTGYLLLALIIEKLSGMGFEDYMQQEILTPLGMTNTEYADERDVRPAFASWYTNFAPSLDRLMWDAREDGPSKSSVIYRNLAVYPHAMHGGAGLITNLTDLVKFEQGLVDGRALSQESLQATLESIRLKDGSTAPYGLGWAVGSLEGHRFMAFGGANSVAVDRFLDDKITIIVLTNLQGAEPYTLALEIAKHYITKW